MAPPELMAIGDSLGNGVRSLMINDVLASHSVSAQIARAFGGIHRARLSAPDAGGFRETVPQPARRNAEPDQGCRHQRARLAGR